MEMNLNMPGGEMANRPLRFFWVVDCSGSMAGDKIGTVNKAIQDCIQPMRDAADDEPNAQLYVQTLRFSTGASWLTAEPVRIEDFAWEDLEADGITDMGKAFEMIAAQLEMPPMPQRALPPVIVLLSDGMPTDDWKRPLEKLLNMPWGKKAVKIAIAIGQNADKKVLEAFTGNSEKVLAADRPETLVRLIKWASTIASAVSSPVTQYKETQPDAEKDNSVEPPLPLLLPPLPSTDDIIDVDVVW